MKAVRRTAPARGCLASSTPSGSKPSRRSGAARSGWFASTRSGRIIRTPPGTSNSRNIRATKCARRVGAPSPTRFERHQTDLAAATQYHRPRKCDDSNVAIFASLRTPSARICRHQMARPAARAELPSGEDFPSNIHSRTRCPGMCCDAGTLEARVPLPTSSRFHHQRVLTASWDQLMRDTCR